MRILKIMHTYTLTYTEGYCIPKYTPERQAERQKKITFLTSKKMNVV